MLQRVRLVVTLLGLLAMFVPPAAAQVTTGTLVGTVHDLSGIVPGAIVTIREVNQGTANSYVTDETGSYTAPFLTPGTYTVEVNVQGFRRWRREGVILQVNQRARVDVTLEVGGIEETTTVTAEAPLLRTDSSEVGTVIEERAIKELPLNGRNFATLVYLTPGITPGQANENLSGASTFNPRGASNFNALGHQANANAWLIDGIDNNEYTFNTVIIAPSVEQVREFKVLSGVFSAEFGRGAGVVSVATKSGSNLLHGTVFEYLRDDAFDARNFFVRKVSQADGSLVKDPKPPLNRHQFGAAVGGPLVLPGLYDGHNRTFFFADYAGLNEKRGQVFVNTVPTALTRTGNFSDFRDANGNLITIYDPLTTRLNPGVRLDPAGQRHESAVPARSLSQQHHPGRAHEPGRAERRQHLPAAERRRQLQQLHVDGRSCHHRQRLLGPRRSPDFREVVVLHALQLGAVQARRPAGTGGLLPGHAGGSRGALRPRPVRRRHPEHAIDDARCGVQLLEDRFAEPGERAAPRLRAHGAVHVPVRLRNHAPPTRWAFAASTSPSSPPACRTSTSRISPASPAVRRSCRSTRSSSTGRSRTQSSGSRGGTS